MGTVECASDGIDALAKLSVQAYDAIFLDVRMPDLDGLELARVLRRFASPPQLVFISAYDGAAVDAFELRALDYLLKPVARARVDEALGRVPRPSAPPGRPAGRRLDTRQAEWRPRSWRWPTCAPVTRLIARSSILYVQSMGVRVQIVVPDGRYLAPLNAV